MSTADTRPIKYRKLSHEPEEEETMKGGDDLEKCYGAGALGAGKGPRDGADTDASAGPGDPANPNKELSDSDENEPLFGDVAVVSSSREHNDRKRMLAAVGMLVGMLIMLMLSASQSGPAVETDGATHIASGEGDITSLAVADKQRQQQLLGQNLTLTEWQTVLESGVVRSHFKYPHMHCKSKDSGKFWKKYEMPAPKGKTCLGFNLFMLKTSSVGAGTLAGITRRIGARYGLSGVTKSYNSNHTRPFPRLVASNVKNHTWLQEAEEHEPTFEFAFVRDPAERCLAELVAAKGNWTDEAIVKFSKSRKCISAQYDSYDMAQRLAGERQPVDLVGVFERPHESILLLGLELGVTLGDILYLQVPKHELGVRRMPQQSKAVKKWFKNRYATFNRNDAALYRAATAVLDRRIEKIGTSRFASLTALYDKHIKAASELCATSDPATGEQVLEDCYHVDHGCAASCLSKYATEHDLWRSLPLILQQQV